MCVCVDFYGALCRELLPSPAVTVTADTRRVAAKGAWQGEQRERGRERKKQLKAGAERSGEGGRRLMHTQLLTFVFRRKCVCECVQVCVFVCVLCSYFVVVFSLWLRLTRDIYYCC